MANQHSSPLSAGLRNHQRAAKQAVSGLLTTPFSTLLTILSIAIALALPGGIFSILNSVSELGNQWDSGREVNVFVTPKASDAQLAQLKKSLGENNQIDAIHVITSQQAARELGETSGITDLDSILGNNTLPPVLVIKPGETVQTTEEFQRLAKEIGQSRLVEDVLVDQEWVQEMHSTLNVLKSFSSLVSVLFALTVVLMISSAMRHTVLQKKQEIEVTKLVGGSDAYILRPFLYRSAIIGLSSGILAVLLIKLAELSLQAPLSQLTGLYAQTLNSGLSIDVVLSVLASGVLIAILSAWITVQIELGKIEPR